VFPVVGTYFEVWGVAQGRGCFARNAVAACRDAGFPKRYQRGSLVVVWVLFLLPTKTAWHFKLPSRSKAFGSHHLIVRFTDFLVHKPLFTKGFWLAAAEIVLRWRDSRNGQRGPCASDTKLYSLKAWCPRRQDKTSNAMRIEVTARTQWSAHTRIPLTRMTSWYKPDLTNGKQSRVGNSDS